MEPAQRRTVALLLVAGMLVAAGLTVLAMRSAAGPQEAADVSVRVEDAEEGILHEGDVHVAAGANDVLAALRALGAAQRFTVETQDYAGLGTMIVAIAGIHNQGACGWVYEVNDRSGDRAADAWRLSRGDHVVWSWSCHA